MRVKVADSFKGELRVEGFNRTFRAGSEFALSDKLFFASHNQWAIQQGYLVPIGDLPSSEMSPSRRLKSNHNRPITFKCLGRAVAPNEKFSVNTEQFEDVQIQQAIAAKFLEEYVEEPKEEKPKKKVAKRKKKTSKKTTKKTEEVSEQEQEAKVQEEKVQDAEKPTEAYVHRPKGARINEPPKMPDKQDTVIVDLDPDTEGDEEFSDAFIDAEHQLEQIRKRAEAKLTKKKTSRKKSSKKRTSRKNNEEVE